MWRDKQTAVLSTCRVHTCSRNSRRRRCWRGSKGSFFRGGVGSLSSQRPPDDSLPAISNERTGPAARPVQGFGCGGGTRHPSIACCKGISIKPGWGLARCPFRSAPGVVSFWGGGEGGVWLHVSYRILFYCIFSVPFRNRLYPETACPKEGGTSQSSQPASQPSIKHQSSKLVRREETKSAYSMHACNVCMHSRSLHPHTVFFTYNTSIVVGRLRQV